MRILSEGNGRTRSLMVVRSMACVVLCSSGAMLRSAWTGRASGARLGRIVIKWKLSWTVWLKLVSCRMRWSGEEPQPGRSGAARYENVYINICVHANMNTYMYATEQGGLPLWQRRMPAAEQRCHTRATLTVLRGRNISKSHSPSSLECHRRRRASGDIR